MKRITWSLLLVLLVNTGIWTALQAAPAPPDADPRWQTAPTSATLIPVGGEVTLYRAGGAAWESIQNPTPIQTGDRIRTGHDGIAVVRWFADDATQQEIYPDSEVFINEGRSNPDGSFWIETSLLSGMVVNRIPREFTDSSRYLVNTPAFQVASSPGVSGVMVAPDFQVDVAVQEGAVLASQRTNERVVQAGNGLSVPRYVVPLPQPIRINMINPGLVSALQTEIDLSAISTTPEPGTSDPGGAVVGTPEPGTDAASINPANQTPEPGFERPQGTREPGDDDSDDRDDDSDDDRDDSDNRDDSDDDSGGGSDEGDDDRDDDDSDDDRGDDSDDRDDDD